MEKLSLPFFFFVLSESVVSAIHYLPPRQGYIKGVVCAVPCFLLLCHVYLVKARARMRERDRLGGGRTKGSEAENMDWIDVDLVDVPLPPKKARMDQGRKIRAAVLN